MLGYCSSCGSEVVKKLEVNGQEISPEGDNNAVCSGCLRAIDLENPQDLFEATEAPPGEASPRGIPGPPRLEDSFSPEGEDFVPAPTSSPEVPIEETARDETAEIATPDPPPDEKKIPVWSGGGEPPQGDKEE